MNRSKLKYNYIQYFGDCPTIFSGTSIAQYRTLRLDYDFDCATFKFIRYEKE